MLFHYFVMAVVIALRSFHFTLRYRSGSNFTKIILPMLKLDTDYGFYKLFLNSNITSFIGYMDNTMIKLPIYFNSHMRIDEQIINIIPKWFHVLYKHTNARFASRHIFFSRNKYLKQPFINFNFCNLSSSGDVVYKEGWWHWHNLVTDLFYEFVNILLPKVSITDLHFKK